MVFAALAFTLIAQVGTANLDDRDVIEKVLTLGLEGGPAKSGRTHFVVLRPNYRRDRPDQPPTRQPYKQWLEELIPMVQDEVRNLEGSAYKEEREQAKGRLEVLKSLLASSSALPSYVPMPTLCVGREGHRTADGYE